MWLDFEYELRTNPKFRGDIERAIKNIQRTFMDAGKGLQYKRLYMEAITEYLKVSKFNLAPLLPYYYPNYPDGPYTLKDFPFAYCYYSLNMGENTYSVLRGSRQIGKCAHPDSKIKVRNRRTNEVKEISIEEFHNMCSSTAKG